MKLNCLVAAIFAALAVVAISAGCSPYYCYSTPKIDLSLAMPATGAECVGDDRDVTSPMTVKRAVDVAIETDTPRPNCLGAAQ